MGGAEHEAGPRALPLTDRLGRRPRQHLFQHHGPGQCPSWRRQTTRARPVAPPARVAQIQGEAAESGYQRHMHVPMARLSGAERRLAVAAPRPLDGFVSRMVDAGGLGLHVREHRAPGTGAQVWVLLHGLAVSHRYLMPTAAALRPASAYVPDLPGFGLSAKPREVYGPR